MPNQSVAGHWHLAGSLKHAETGLPARLNHVFPGGGELILVRRADALSPHISVSKTNQFLIPELTVTTPSGQQVNFHHVRVKSQSDTYEMEQITFSYPMIDINWNDGKTTGVDDLQR